MPGTDNQPYTDIEKTDLGDRMSEHVNLFDPSPGWLIVKPLNDDDARHEYERTSGIFLPEQVEMKREVQGIVIAVGVPKITENGSVLSLLWSLTEGVEVGERVLYTQHGGIEFKDKTGTLYILLQFGHIIARIRYEGKQSAETGEGLIR